MFWYQISIWPMGSLTCAVRILSLIFAGVKWDSWKTIQVNCLMTSMKHNRGQRDSEYRCCSRGLWKKITTCKQRCLAEGSHKTLSHGRSISFYCLLTITLQNQNNSTLYVSWDIIKSYQLSHFSLSVHVHWKFTSLLQAVLVSCQLWPPLLHSQSLNQRDQNWTANLHYILTIYI